MKKIILFSALAALTFSGCATSEKKDLKPTSTQEEGPAEKAGKKIDENIEALQQKAKELHQKSIELKDKMKDQWNKQNAPANQ